jgi:hypothetical protein
MSTFSTEAWAPFFAAEAGVLLLAGHSSGLYWLVAGVIFSLIASVLNAWILLVEIIRSSLFSSAGKGLYSAGRETGYGDTRRMEYALRTRGRYPAPPPLWGRIRIDARSKGVAVARYGTTVIGPTLSCER